MEVVAQTLDEILDNLISIEVDWKDETARNVIERLKAFPVKDHYTKRRHRGSSDPELRGRQAHLPSTPGSFEGPLRGSSRKRPGKGRNRVKRYKADPDRFLEALEELALPKRWLRKLHGICTGATGFLNVFAADAGALY